MVRINKTQIVEDSIGLRQHTREAAVYMPKLRPHVQGGPKSKPPPNYQYTVLNRIESCQ